MEDSSLRKRNKQLVDNGNIKVDNGNRKEDNGNIKVDSQALGETTLSTNPVITLLKSMLNICIGVVKYSFLALLIIAFLNYTALIREERELKPEGQFISTEEGQKFHISCRGKGKPTVILDAPNGVSSDIWTFLLPKLEEITQVCTFDRAGLGYSDRPGKNSSMVKGMQHTVERMTEDMKEIFVNKRNLERPFVLVGVELGAINAHFYAEMYPNDVAAVVLINPYHHNLFNVENGLWKNYWFNSVLPTLQLLHLASVAGFTRIGLHLNLLKEMFDKPDINETVKHRQRFLMCKPGHLSSSIEENFMLNTSLSQLRLLHKLRQFPKGLLTTIVSSEKYSRLAPDAINDLWKTSQDKVAELFPVKIHKMYSRVPADRVLLEDYETISKAISQTLLEWRKTATKETKY